MLVYTARSSSANALRAFARSRAQAAATGQNIRHLSTSQQAFAEAQAASPTPSPAAVPGAAASSSKAVSPKLTSIVDQIEQLTLLEAAELVAQLKERLNIQEIAMPAAAAAAPAAAAPAAEAVEEEEKPKEKTVFTLKLKGLKDASAKAKVIKEIKALNSTMNLVEAKKFVESAPQVLKEGLTKDEAEKLQKVIEDAGGVVERD